MAAAEQKNHWITKGKVKIFRKQLFCKLQLVPDLFIFILYFADTETDSLHFQKNSLVLPNFVINLKIYMLSHWNTISLKNRY